MSSWLGERKSRTKPTGTGGLDGSGSAAAAAAAANFFFPDPFGGLNINGNARKLSVDDLHDEED